jgi:hypothetical protein
VTRVAPLPKHDARCAVVAAPASTFFPRRSPP